MISLIRRARERHDWLVVVLNWTPIIRYDYRIGVPEAGYYREILNSDAERLRRRQRRQPGRHGHRGDPRARPRRTR